MDDKDYNRTMDIMMDYIQNLTYGNQTHNMTDVNCEADLPIIALVNQILYAIVCIVGLLGNSLVIYVVLRFSKMQTVTNMYIVNLAIADECFLIGIPFLVTTISLRSWIFGKVMCKAYMTTTSINQFTSSIFLFIMSADRYIAVCHPISSPKMRTPFISKVVSLTAWTTSALFMVPVFLYANAMESPEGIVSCNIYWPNDRGGQTTFTLYTLILGFAVPLALILIFYFLVIKKLRTVGPKNKSKEKKRSHRKVTKLVLTVITVYVFCWLPYWVMQVALIYTPPKQCQTNISITSFLLAGFLSYSNSAMNPILYAFLSDNFKKSFLKACTCAAGKDVNAALHIENSVFPRRNKGSNADRLQSNRMITSGQSRLELEDEEAERGLLISKTSTTTVTMTSRSNITVNSDPKDSAQKDKDLIKNGAQLTRLTQV
ncbi:somatostatin receptor type 2-like [Linepithema humile]|uniref:somatostatin receptor type 2-like n=1 Tax=Linepithema humile TaxID=83485 RepID=UPI0006232383|nr:PREDICTED: somatostatin receptor type 2-like [Linepithema humile]XP_012233867.1 PREDICTED: somatostatin receptor type 2-like [Linepithema humile]XP_012233868.1 PREDICTED: somatostatin receptor type 2-like [Linepithema humile]XP_012233869.1 PREDICTED: somatostatin receptor type 2-like [Linepithema humile]